MVLLVLLPVLIAYGWLLYRYLESIKSVADLANSFGIQLGIVGAVRKSTSQLAVLSDFGCYMMLLRATYEKSNYPEDLLHAMREARKYMLLQIPISIVAFCIPVLFSLI